MGDVVWYDLDVVVVEEEGNKTEKMVSCILTLNKPNIIFSLNFLFITPSLINKIGII